jgi:hypothetical protein
MAKRAKQRAGIRDQRLKRNLFLVSLAVLLVKFVLILSIKSGGWLGADGESYLYGVDALIKSGFASKDIQLIYWPAGYPLIIWMLTFISMAKVIYLISFAQSILYFVATAFFVERIRLTRLPKLALPLAIVLGLNPTLSLSSLAIGYESAVASCYLLIVAIILRYQQDKTGKNHIKTVLGVGLIQGVSTFMQPTGILLGIFIFIFWGIFMGGWKNIATTVLIGTCVIMIFPSVLVLRNIQANGTVAITNSLGATMNVGAGDKASGGFPGRTGSYGVPCSPKAPATLVSDSRKARCVITWYVKHPVKTAVLAVKKSIDFWSPWSGPLANGSMARNPWLKINPIGNIASNQAGHDLVFGWFGKVISWVWFALSLFLLFYGFRWLWQMGGVERELSILAGTPILLAWLISVGTIGDHRYRLPTMGLSLFLQVSGYFGLKERFAGGAGRPTLEPRGRSR